MIIHTKFGFGDRLNVDGDQTLAVTVVAISLQGSEEAISYECSWFNGGAAVSAWFREWRLSSVHS